MIYLLSIPLLNYVTNTFVFMNLSRRQSVNLAVNGQKNDLKNIFPKWQKKTVKHRKVKKSGKKQSLFASWSLTGQLWKVIGSSSFSINQKGKGLSLTNKTLIMHLNLTFLLLQQPQSRKSSIMLKMIEKPLKNFKKTSKNALQR